MALVAVVPGVLPGQFATMGRRLGQPVRRALLALRVRPATKGRRLGQPVVLSALPEPGMLLEPWQPRWRCKPSGQTRTAAGLLEPPVVGLWLEVRW